VREPPAAPAARRRLSAASRSARRQLEEKRGAPAARGFSLAVSSAGRAARRGRKRTLPGTASEAEPQTLVSPWDEGRNDLRCRSSSAAPGSWNPCIGGSPRRFTATLSCCSASPIGARGAGWSSSRPTHTPTGDDASSLRRRDGREDSHCGRAWTYRARPCDRIGLAITTERLIR
jgi:hypothetical protein